MLSNTNWARGIEPPIRAAIANAISAQCVSWHIDYAQFREHVNEHLTSVDRHRAQRQNKVDAHMTLISDCINALKANVARQHQPAQW